MSKMVLHNKEGRNFIESGTFVCVEVLRPSQSNGVISIAVSLLNHTFLGRLSPLSG